MIGVNRNVEMAAQSLGASRWRTFRYVTLPLIRPGMVASLVFAFILSFDEVAASLFVSSPSAMTLPVRIFVYIDQNYDPLVTSVSSLLVFAASDRARHHRAHARRRPAVRPALTEPIGAETNRDGDR